MIKLKGDKDLIRFLETLPDRYVRPAKAATLQAAAKPIWLQARANIKAMGLVKTKKLIRSMGAVIRRYRKSVNVVAVIGNRLLGNSRESTAWYAHMIEFGTGPRYQEKRRKFVGAIPARPFLEPAFNSQLPESQRIIAERLTKEVTKAFEKAAAKMR